MAAMGKFTLLVVRAVAVLHEGLAQLGLLFCRVIRRSFLPLSLIASRHAGFNSRGWPGHAGTHPQALVTVVLG